MKKSTAAILICVIVVVLSALTNEKFSMIITLVRIL